MLSSATTNTQTLQFWSTENNWLTPGTEIHGQGALGTRKIRNDNENHLMLLLCSFVPGSEKDVKYFCQSSDWYWLFFAFSALNLGTKPRRKEGQILQCLNTDKSQRSLETGQIFQNMLHQVLVPQKSPRSPRCSKTAKIKDYCMESFGFLGADRCGERKKKENTNEGTNSRYL